MILCITTKIFMPAWLCKKMGQYKPTNSTLEADMKKYGPLASAKALLTCVLRG